MTGVDDAVVKQKLRNILQTADLDTITERKVIADLEAQLGQDVQSFRKLIKAEIAAFLAEDDDSQDGDDAVANEGPSTTATKRPLDASHNKISLSENRLIETTVYKGTPYVDLREYYTDKEGELKPTRKGVMLNPGQFKSLAASASSIATALENEDLEYTADLSGNKFAKVVESLKGGVSVDIREWYENDGEQLPTKKGIRLTSKEWDTVLENLSTLESTLQGLEEKLPKKAKVADKVQVESSSRTTPQNTDFLDLGNKRRAEVTEFKGMKFLNIREYYEKNGELLPGSKGIALSKEQFDTLLQHAEALSTAMNDEQEGMEVALSGKRKAQVSSFKGKLYLGIREFYTKDGKKLPGKKGISLTPEQWTKLAAELPSMKDKF